MASAFDGPDRLHPNRATPAARTIAPVTITYLRRHLMAHLQSQPLTPQCSPTCSPNTWPPLKLRQRVELIVPDEAREQFRRRGFGLRWSGHGGFLASGPEAGIQIISFTNSHPAPCTARSKSSRNLPNSRVPPPPTLLSTRVWFTRVPYCVLALMAVSAQKAFFLREWYRPGYGQAFLKAPVL